MSPIRNPEHYPEDWPEVRRRILRRAEDRENSPPRCECLGECGVDHSSLDGGNPGRCIERNGSWAATFGSGTGGKGDNRAVRVVLTVAHLDHDASAGDHSDENLKALCQSCHLRYDAPYNAAKRRRAREQTERLFEGV